jgi:hypothetical protein
MAARMVSIAIALLLMAPASSSLAAKPSAGALEFSGWEADRARHAAIAGMRELVDIVPLHRITGAAERLHVDPRSPIGLAMLIDELQLTLLIVGRVSASGAASATQIQVFGPDGSRLADWEGAGPGRGDAAIKKGTKQAVREALARVRRPAIAETYRAAPIGSKRPRASALAGEEPIAVNLTPIEVVPEPLPPPTPARPVAQPAVLARVEPAPLVVAKAEPVAQPAPVVTQIASQAPAQIAAAPAPAPAKVPLAIKEDDARSVIVPKDEWVEPQGERQIIGLAGITMRRRTAEIDLSDGQIAKYDSGYYPELTLLAHARPFAGAGSFLNGIYAELEGAFAVGLSSIAKPNGADVSTSAFRLRFASGCLYALGPIELGGDLGFGSDSFSLEANEILESVSYTYWRASALARAPLANGAFVLAIDGGFRGVFSAGDLGRLSNQAANAHAFEASASATGSFDFGLSYAIRMSRVSYGLSFSQSPDSTPTRGSLQNEALGGRDSSWLFTFGFGWRFR